MDNTTWKKICTSAREGRWLNNLPSRQTCEQWLSGRENEAPAWQFIVEALGDLALASQLWEG